MAHPAPPVLVTVTRDGVLESAHRGHLVVTDAEGRVLTAHGDADFPTYLRSAVKPFQAIAVLELLGAAGLALDPVALAIVCASHTASDEHQIEAARVLALADLDESALRCPPALPEDLPTLCSQRDPTALAHNCSGKHAGFLYATVASGADPAGYLALNAPLQRAIRRRLAESISTPLEGPGVDGCGAPAWIAPLRGLATGFARLAGGDGELARIRDAMQARPDLVGGAGCDDTALMQRDGRVVAKRGAEGVLAAGFVHPRFGAVGVAVKIEDGSRRAAGPAVAAALEALGAIAPRELRRIPVYGGSQPHGVVRAIGELSARITEALGIS